MTPDTYRYLIIALCVLVEVLIVAAWLLLRGHPVFTGPRRVNFAASASLVACLGYGSAEVLYGWTSTYRLPLLVFALTLFAVGMGAEVRNAVRTPSGDAT